MRGKPVVIDAEWLEAIRIKTLLEYPPNRLVYQILKGFVIVTAAIVALPLIVYPGLFIVKALGIAVLLAFLLIGPYVAALADEFPHLPQYLMGIGIGSLLVVSIVRVAQRLCKWS